jgi:hypothetical protein
MLVILGILLPVRAKKVLQTPISTQKQNKTKTKNKNKQKTKLGTTYPTLWEA